MAKLGPVQAAMQKAQKVHTWMKGMDGGGAATGFDPTLLHTHTHTQSRQAIQRNDFENHAKAVAEGMQALSWVVVKPAPRDFIENFVGASDFWGNKASDFDWNVLGLCGYRRLAHSALALFLFPQVRIQYKKTNAEHVAFVDAYKKLIVDLMAYVKEWHTTGVAWNAQVSLFL